MNDWWNYLAHSEVGGERKDHKYYARVVVGTDKRGLVQYRYFCDAREYGAYKTRKQNADKNHKIFSKDPKEISLLDPHLYSLILELYANTFFLLYSYLNVLTF